MRNLFMWMMVFGIVAGLNVRVMGFEHAHPPDVSHGCDHHHHGHDHHHGHGEEPHSNDCQPGSEHEGESHQHHHGCCSPAHPLTIEMDHQRQSREPGSTLLGVCPDREVPPDEPLLGSEKPPLI